MIKLLGAEPNCIAVASILVLIGCGTADENAPGRCVTSSQSGYVGATTDTNGKKWSFDVQPESISLFCVSPGGTGVVQVIGTVRDGQGLPISSVSVGSAVSEFGGLRLVTNENLAEILGQFRNFSGAAQRITASDESTDDCGVALFSVFFACPSAAGLSVGGSFMAYSGPLFSKPVSIQVQLQEPDDDDSEVTPAAQPAAPAAPSTPTNPTAPSTPTTPTAPTVPAN